MQPIRIVAGSAVVLFFAGLALGNAAAQTAANGAPGKPMQLLTIVEQSIKTKTKRHAKSLANTSVADKSLARARGKVRLATRKQTKSHRTVAETRKPPAPAQVAQGPAAAASIWPAASPPSPGPVTTADQAPQPAVAAPDQVVVDGQTVKIASPNDVNDVDLSADSGAAAGTVAPGSPPENAPAMTATAEADAKSDTTKAASTPPPQSDVGTTSWILQVLAALGGAVAAGSAAWLLIGSAPQRTYG